MQKETEAALNTVEQHNPDSDIWVPEYLTPSWVCLPNDQPVLAIIQPEDLPLDILKMICKVGMKQMGCSLFFFVFLYNCCRNKEALICTAC